MSSFFAGVGLVAVLASFTGAMYALPATPEGAARIASSLQKYPGRKEGVVFVVPNGPVYDVTVDSAPLVMQSDAPEIAITISPQHRSNRRFTS